MEDQINSMSVLLQNRPRKSRGLLKLDDLVVQRVEAPKARGVISPYFKSFVVARINPVRFRPKDAEPLSFDEALERMTKVTVS